MCNSNHAQVNNFLYKIVDNRKEMQNIYFIDTRDIKTFMPALEDKSSSIAFLHKLELINEPN